MEPIKVLVMIETGGEKKKKKNQKKKKKKKPNSSSTLLPSDSFSLPPCFIHVS